MRGFFVAGALAVALGMSGREAVPAPMEDVNQVIDNTPDSIFQAMTARPVAGSSRRGDNPVLFLVGNSTMRTGTKGNGDSGQWGWGFYMGDHFDKSRITVENHALGGMSSRTFYNRLWGDVVKGIRPGDWVIIELGHNDNGPYDSGRARASIPGTGRDSLEVTIKETGAREVVFSFGEYMRRYIDDVRARGGRPVLMSLTPRNAWDDADSTVVTRVRDTYGAWAREIAREKGVPFVDLNEISAAKMERMGKEKVKTLFYKDRIHTSVWGAKMNAASAAEGIAGCDGLELKDYLLEVAVENPEGLRRPGAASFVVANRPVTWRGDVELIDQSTTARGLVDGGRWDVIANALEPGDTVRIAVEYRPGEGIAEGSEVGELPGDGGESRVCKMGSNGRNVVVYTHGWYIRKMVMDAREKGATVIVEP